MIDPNYADLDIEAYESNLKAYGICPYQSMGMSKIPCTNECALYISADDEARSEGRDQRSFVGCSIKLQALARDLPHD